MEKQTKIIKGLNAYNHIFSRKINLILNNNILFWIVVKLLSYITIYQRLLLNLRIAKLEKEENVEIVQEYANK